MDKVSRRKLTDMVPLSIKMALLTLLAGLSSWAFIDHYQARQLDSIMKSQLHERLEWMAQKDRSLFDNYLRSYSKSVKLFVNGKDFKDYLDSHAGSWRDMDDPDITYYNFPPKWFPPTSVVRTFISVRYALLLDRWGNTREIFETGPQLPEHFRHPTDLLRTLSHNQSFMTEIEGKPYLVASDSLLDDYDRPVATMMLVSPIDYEFLISTQGTFYKDHVVAILEEDGTRVVASSDDKAFPHGMEIRKDDGTYILTGKSFFDYGASDLRAQFVTIVSTEELRAMGSDIAALGKRQRLILAATMVLVFIIIAMWISRRISRLSAEVQAFASSELGHTLDDASGGDRISLLAGQFSALSTELANSRKRLEKETEEKLALINKAALARMKENELAILKQVTSTLGVGVLKTHDGVIAPANKLMADFCECCGGPEAFSTSANSEAEYLYTDDSGRRRCFHIQSPDLISGERIMLVRDITEKKNAEEEIRKLTLAIDQSPSVIIITDLFGVVEYVNNSFYSSTGLSAHNVLGREISYFEDMDFVKSVFDTAETDITVTREFQRHRKDGSLCWEMVIAKSIRQEGGAISNYLFVKQDITERKAMEERMLQISITDELTGLLNRRGFITIAQKQINIADRMNLPLYLLFLDMDNMKWINDTLGHKEGDNSLIEVARILNATFRSSDIIGRLGGDEFAVVVTNTTQTDNENTIRARLDENIRKANKQGKRNFFISASTGIIKYDPAQTATVEDLLIKADTMMYKIKRSKKS